MRSPRAARPFFLRSPKAKAGRNRRPIFIFLSDQRRRYDLLEIARNLPPESWFILRLLPAQELQTGHWRLREVCRQRAIRFLVANDLTKAVALRADGLHLSEKLGRVGVLSSILSWRRHGKLLTMSAHSQAALARASQIGVDAALLSLVFRSASHPGAATLGRLGFARLVKAAPPDLTIIPLGGMTSTTFLQLKISRPCGFASATPQT